MHTTQELSQACLRDPAVASLIQGVFPKLPTIYTYPAGLITNTNPHDQPGRSYGFPPETYNMDTYILREATFYNYKPLKGLASDICGDYCLFYLLHRAGNLDMNTIQAKFKPHDTVEWCTSRKICTQLYKLINEHYIGAVVLWDWTNL